MVVAGQFGLLYANCYYGSKDACYFLCKLYSLICNVIITREPRACDSEAKGPREYWWEAPSIRSIGGDQGSYGGNPQAKGNTGIKGLLGMLGMLGKGVQGVYIYRALS